VLARAPGRVAPSTARHELSQPVVIERREPQRASTIIVEDQPSRRSPMAMVATNALRW
jgi:hypothetical protein